jgi:hypothetical protein
VNPPLAGEPEEFNFLVVVKKCYEIQTFFSPTTYSAIPYLQIFLWQAPEK